MTDNELQYEADREERWRCQDCGRIVAAGMDCPTCAELERQFDRQKERY